MLMEYSDDQSNAILILINLHIDFSNQNGEMRILKFEPPVRDQSA